MALLPCCESCRQVATSEELVLPIHRQPAAPTQQASSRAEIIRLMPLDLAQKAYSVQNEPNGK
jgi:hypothetical protein